MRCPQCSSANVKTSKRTSYVLGKDGRAVKSTTHLLCVCHDCHWSWWEDEEREVKR